MIIMYPVHKSQTMKFQEVTWLQNLVHPVTGPALGYGTLLRDLVHLGTGACYRTWFTWVHDLVHLVTGPGSPGYRSLLQDMVHLGT